MKKFTSVVLVVLLLSSFLHVVAFANEDMNNEELGVFLARKALYHVRDIEDEKKSVGIELSLDDDDFIRLSYGQVLKSFAKHAYELQKDYANEEEDFVLMSAEHIAGEAWLHVIGFRLATAFGGEEGLMSSFYDSVKNVYLNIDEDRIPTYIFDYIGTIILL